MKNSQLQQSLLNILFNLMDIEEIVEGKGIEEVESKIEEIKRIVIEIMDED